MAMMWGAGGWAWMGIGMIVWVVLIVLVVWLLVRVLGRSDSAGPGAPWRGPTPAEELRMRFARGEINEEEYRSRLAVLNERTPGT
jgi:putative membrane protein